MAERGARLLNLTLTKRGASNGAPIKMAGVPVVAVEQYLGKLVKLEYFGEAGAAIERAADPARARERRTVHDKIRALYAAAFQTGSRRGGARFFIF